MTMFVIFVAAALFCTGEAMDDDLQLSYETVSSLAGLPLHCYNTEYPNKLNQVLGDNSDLLSPSGELGFVESCYFVKIFKHSLFIVG